MADDLNNQLQLEDNTIVPASINPQDIQKETNDETEDSNGAASKVNND